jgi:aspartyl/asparaginyl beta-hydroxylase (cupin superfamily)
MMSAEDARTKELVESAVLALRQGNARGALDLLRRAEADAPADVAVKMQIALALRTLGEFDGALRALDAALTLDPYQLLALLSKGWILEKVGRARDAAAVYRNALKIAPPDDRLAEGLKAPVARARQAVKEDTEALEAHLKASVADIRTRLGDEKLGRFDESLEVFAGKKRVYTPEPVYLHYPRLPADQFYDRDLFPWLPELEAATEAIREELAVVLREDLEALDPYIQYPPGAPVNQWVELNHSPRWNSYFLWKDGERQDDHCARCPNTAAVLEKLPMLDQPGFGPSAMFSVLAPRTHIPPHTGSSNTRLVVHLPLVLPPDCAFRVGNDTREWKMGEAWVFDDTIDHEAWNNSDQTRTILIFDVWNPYLTPAERELVTAMMAAKKAYAGAEG